MLAMFVEYSREKNMADVIFFGSTVGSHQISNEVRRNVSALAALLLTSWRELSVLSNGFFSFSIFKMYVYTLLMRNFGFENRVRWPTRRPSFKTR